MPRKPKSISPLDSLLPYQRNWIDDDARFKIGLMARQTGKSWTSALESVRDCLERKTTWVCLSRGERQSLEWMEKAREHIKAFQVALAGYEEDRGGVAEALLKAAEARFPNGSRIVALPANPDTARGYSANLLLDEFAFHENPDAIWRAIYPSISNPLKGIFKIRVVSTPNGLGNKFADLWNKPNNWSKHHVDIYEAVKAGLPVNLDEIKAGLDDPEGWAQEYECQFLDAAAVLLPYELIATCESAEATVAMPPEFWLPPCPPGRALFMGIDFARKRDLSVAWTDELVGDVTQAREVLEMRGMSTPDQIDLLRPRIRMCRRVCLDYTGPGVGMGDYLVKEFGEYNPEKHQFGKIELCTFTNPLKVEIFSKLRMVFEGMKTRVPVNRAVREDLHSVQRVTTPTGNVTYRAPHSDDGHADRCTAKALAERARGTGSNGAITPEILKQIRFGRPAAGVRHFNPRRLVQV
jgi:phage FluMu gp28-like protein